MIVLGSSLTVSPACDLPLYAKDLVIVNLQHTQHDEKASIRIFAKTDLVMELLMKELGLTIPDFQPDHMRDTLVYQPPPGARHLRKPVTIEPVTRPVIDEADKINVDNLKVFVTFHVSI